MEKRYASDLKLAKHLGAGKSGTEHWIRQRITAMLLVIPMLVCLYFLKQLAPLDKQVVEKLLTNIWFVSSLVAIICIGLYHGQLGMQVIFEDYLYSHKAIMVTVFCTKLVTYSTILVSVLAVLKVFFNSN